MHGDGQAGVKFVFFRNFVFVIIKVGAAPALPALVTALRDSDRFIRWSAVRTLGKIGPSAGLPAQPELIRVLLDPDGDLREAAATALSRLRSEPRPPGSGFASGP